MATATKAKPKTLEALLDEQRQDEQKLHALREQLDLIHAETHPARLVTGPATKSASELLRLAESAPDLRREARLLEAVTIERRAEIQAARRQQREQERAKALRKLGPLVEQLDKALGRVEELVLEALPIDDEAGAGATSAWRLMISDPGRREGLLDLWRADMRERGLLAAVELVEEDEDED